MKYLPIALANREDAGQWFVFLSRDGRLSQPLAGPYPKHGDAMDAVPKVHALAEEADAWAAFDSPVTASVRGIVAPVFGMVTP